MSIPIHVWVISYIGVYVSVVDRLETWYIHMFEGNNFL